MICLRVNLSYSWNITAKSVIDRLKPASIRTTPSPILVIPENIQRLYDFLLTDGQDLRPLCFIFRNKKEGFERAKRFKQEFVTYQQMMQVKGSKVVCVVSEDMLTVQLQIEADTNGIELWTDFDDAKFFVEQLEVAALGPHRVRPDENENVDADIYDSLKTLSQEADVRKLLIEAKTIQNVSNMPPDQLNALAGNDTIHRFLSQLI
jgi:hypothetical protein